MATPRKSPYTRLGSAPNATVEPYSVPGSVGGVNSLDSLMMMPEQDCIYTYNLMPVEYGLRLRKGYRQWATDCVESPQRGSSSDVKSMIPYESQLRDAARDRLFAVTEEGIWNVTNFGEQNPSQEVVFSVTDGAGYGVWTEFTNDSGRHFLFYADSINGLHQYEEGVGWSQPVGGTGPGEWQYLDGGTPTAFPVDDIAFVCVHKLRIWVILENSDDAWYLPLYSIAGELKKFSFGSKLVHGGNLMGIYTWSLDGGDGMDDYFIACSRGGDVAVYRGSDPEATDWSIVGSWFIGELPESRRVAAEYGSEMYILSTFGITSLRDLLQGTVANDLRSSPSAKVNRFLQADVNSGKVNQEWAVEIHPADGFMQVLTPAPSNTPFIQYNQNLQTKAWGFWRDVPVISATTWNGDYFMGGMDGVVYIYDGELDGTTLPGADLFTPFPPNIANRWTQDGPAPTTNSYTYDGSSGSGSQLNITQLTAAVPGNSYEITYTVDTADTNLEHQAMFGSLSAIEGPIANGPGTFVVRVIAPTNSALFSFLVPSSFTGTATVRDIEVREPATLGAPIEFSTLTSFQPLGVHGNFKIPAFIRTIGVVTGTVDINVKAVFDYSIEEEAAPSEIPPASEGSLWNSALWDSAIWGGGPVGSSAVTGVLGIGRAMAVACRGTSISRITVVGWDVTYNMGGLL